MTGTVHWMVAESKLVEMSIRLVGFTGGVGSIGSMPIDQVKERIDEYMEQ